MNGKKVHYTTRGLKARIGKRVKLVSWFGSFDTGKLVRATKEGFELETKDGAYWLGIELFYSWQEVSEK